MFFNFKCLFLLWQRQVLIGQDGKILMGKFWNGINNTVMLKSIIKMENIKGSARPETGEIYKPPVKGRTIEPYIKVSVGTGVIYGGLKLLDWATSRLAPVFMTPLIMQTINPQPNYYQEL